MLGGAVPSPTVLDDQDISLYVLYALGGICVVEDLAYIAPPPYPQFSLPSHFSLITSSIDILPFLPINFNTISGPLQ